MIAKPKPTIFEFTSYKFEPDKRKVFLNYKQRFDGREAIVFTETIILPEAIDTSKVSEKLVNKLLQGLHLVAGVSYYKFYCATKLKIPYRKHFFLSDETVCSRVSLFCVSVPVLSAHKISIFPRSSMADNLFTTTFCFAIFRLPSDKANVTTTGNASGKIRMC